MLRDATQETCVIIEHIRSLVDQTIFESHLKLLLLIRRPNLNGLEPSLKGSVRVLPMLATSTSFLGLHELHNLDQMIAGC